MTISAGQLIVWVIIGALGGSLAGWVVTHRKRGYGRLTNIVIGMIGAVLGGFLFDLLNVDLGLGELTITAEDIVAAFVGSLILLVGLRILRNR